MSGFARVAIMLRKATTGRVMTVRQPIIARTSFAVTKRRALFPTILVRIYALLVLTILNYDLYLYSVYRFSEKRSGRWP